jgi:effector-binding domain-containing protein
MTTGTIEITERSAQPAAVVRGHVSPTGIAAFVGEAFGEVATLLEKEHGDVAGPPFARYHRTSDGFDVEAGFPAARGFSPVGRVEQDQLPGGPTATVLYTGPYDGIGPAYGALLQWLAAHGNEPVGDPWESYLDGPEVAEPRTLISVPCRGA